jgi:hypothetical protein
MDLLLSPAWAAGRVRAVVVAQQAGVETPGWLIALIGVVGVGIGGLMTLWGNHLSASREEKRRNQDRLWEEKRRNQDRLWEEKRRNLDRLWKEKRKLYETVILWIGRTEKALRDLHYSYAQYVMSPPPTAENAPRPLLMKQAEYRQIIPPDQWEIPDQLGENLLTLLGAYAPPEIAQMAVRVQYSAIRMADEVRSLGRYTIDMPTRSDADQAGADSVINRYYKMWLTRSNRLMNMVRREFDPEAKLIPLDKGQLPQWDALPEYDGPDLGPSTLNG